MNLASFKDQQREIRFHRDCHRNNEPLSRDYSCLSCYPLNNILPDLQFQNFWTWLSNYYRTDTYSAYTITALPVYCQLFQQEQTEKISTRTTTYLVKLLFSIRYIEAPLSLHKLILEVFQLTFRTNFFTEPVTQALYLIVDLFLSSPPQSESGETLKIDQLNNLLNTQEDLGLVNLFQQTTTVQV